jgi:hypothetical protein
MELAISILSLGTSYISFIRPDDAKEKVMGYGSFSRSLSGKPFEIVRGKRTESITLSYSKMTLDEYDMLRYIWDNGLYFNLESYVPRYSHVSCFIPIDGFGITPGQADTYQGTITIVVS